MMIIPRPERLSDRFAVDYNDQDDCPFFVRTPAEMRNRIFALALSSYDAGERPSYHPDTYFTRPGYYHPQRIDTSLLVTCRRIYLETHLVPVAVNEHVFWCGRGPPGSTSDPKAYFGRLTDEQRAAVVRVHFFAQMLWLEGTFPKVCLLREMRVKTLKITIRHSDWWFWESNTKLRIGRDWGRRLMDLDGLEELEMELETIERDKDQLNVIAAGLTAWRFKLHGGRVLTTAGLGVIHTRWVGPISFEGSLRYSDDKKMWESIRERPHTRHTTEPGLVYCVVTLRWRASDSD